jgi:hypothetical protein
MTENIIITPFTIDKKGAWKDFLNKSNNGTLFHDLDFLSYHKDDAFSLHHLIFYQSSKLIGLLPAASILDKNGKKILRSPYGASVGGLVLPLNIGFETTMRIVDSLIGYVRNQGFSSIEFSLVPTVYMHFPNQTLEFALSVNGFILKNRVLCFIVPLNEQGWAQLVNMRKINNMIRAGEKDGLVAFEAEEDALDIFYTLLQNTMDRHNSTATHTKEELKKIINIVPKRIRIFLCTHNDTPIAGVMVFLLNSHVATTFYICGQNTKSANKLLNYYIIKILHKEGYRFLDMGPSASTLHCNHGAIFFKERLGALGHCRDSWFLNL